ncbi:MAG: hypothetical protein VX436_01505, partial [Planctomycetota bacterium]|nr:hypothetical protein [Planctomycetota bacterium]
MRKPNHHIGHILALITCSIVVVSCDSPITIYEPSDFGSMNSGYPIQGFDGKHSNSESDVLRRRLFDAYVDYWPLISSEDQHKRLPKVLTDPIPEIRAFGVERVAVLLRDGEAMEEELQLVATLLQDPHPTVRLAVAKLLPEINIAGKRIEHSEYGPMSLPEYVATSLEKEKRQSIAALELAFFQTRPHSNAVKPSIKRLESGPVDPAAKTIFALLNSKMFEIEDDQKRQIFKIVQRHLRINNISKLPSLITLNAMLGSPTVKQGLVHLLQNSDKS